ncbi:MAG: hypothetical protein HOE69_05220 [Euryarchaeota archaeon]|nr:hypothetical protein [Euryarchaeota archaeon]
MPTVGNKKSRKKMILAFLIVPLLSSLPVLADPPPGTPDVTNNYCATWSNGTGICDDYNFAHDASASGEWVRSNYDFVMHNTTSITMTLEWEMHEFDRAAIGLEAMDLGGGFDANNSGAPVDYIRNYLGYTTSSGLQVRQLILNEFSSAVESLVNDTYSGSAVVESQIVNQVTIEGQSISCTDDMNADSIDEVFGLPNNAFEPPLCLRSVAQIDVGTDLLGIGDSSIDIERAFQGLLTMGAEVSSNFTLVSRPGHRSTFTLTPPNYATFSEVGGNGSLVPQIQGSTPYNAGSWMTDGLSDLGSGNSLSTASITSIYRNGTTNAVSIDPETDHGISIYATADLRDETNTRLSAEIDVHYLPQSVLEDWGFSLGSGNIEIPWITSDGIRMAHEYGLLDLDDFSNMIPLGDIESAVFSATEIDLVMNPLTWKEPDNSGGLNFTHSPGTTCGELIQVTHCLLGVNAMEGTFPVTMETSSEPFPADPLEKLTTLISAQDGLENLSSIPKEDISAILSILVYEHELDTSFIAESLPDWLPPTEIELTILLPDWIASNVGDPHSITLTASSGGGETTSLEITGPNPYHRRWSDPICDVSAACSDSSSDLICKSDWRSCIGVKATLDLPSFEIHEWSQEIELIVEGDISVDIYRIEAPGVLTDDFGVSMEAIPSDLIRHVIAFGDEQDGGINGLLGQTIDVPLGDQTHQLEISNNGLQSFANSLADMMNDELSAMQQSDEMLSVDLSGLHFSASVPWMERPYDGVIDDDEPLSFSLSLDRTKISAQYYDGAVNINTAPGYGAIPSIFEGLLDTFNIKAASGSNGVVTLPPEPILVPVEPISEQQDLDGSIDTNEDGDPNNDRDLDIRPAITLELTMPRGLEIEFSSSMGRDEQKMLGGSRRQIIYRVPLCTEVDPNDCAGQSDEVSLQFTIGYAFIFQEILPYLMGLLLLIILLVYRRRRKKAQKREAKKEKQLEVRSVSVNTHAVERELLGLQPMGGAGGAANDGSDWFTGIDLDDDNW